MTKEFRHIGCGGEFDHGEPCSECGDYCKCGTVCAAPCPFCEETGANEEPEGPEGDAPTETDEMPVASPCERCGSADIFIEREDLSVYQARCNDCGSRGPIVEEGRYYDDEEAGQRDAIAAWNKRATAPAPAATSAAQWMPMDSAPDDGTLFLAAVHVRHNKTKEEWWEQHIIARDDETGDVHADHYQGWDWGDYSHWMPLPAAPGAQPAQPAALADLILVPRDLIGAACSAIDKKRDAPKTLAELRRYTMGDLSAQPAQDSLTETAECRRILEEMTALFEMDDEANEPGTDSCTVLKQAQDFLRSGEGR